MRQCVDLASVLWPCGAAPVLAGNSLESGSSGEQKRASVPSRLAAMPSSVRLSAPSRSPLNIWKRNCPGRGGKSCDGQHQRAADLKAVPAGAEHEARHCRHLLLAAKDDCGAKGEKGQDTRQSAVGSSRVKQGEFGNAQRAVAARFFYII